MNAKTVVDTSYSTNTMGEFSREDKKRADRDQVLGLLLFYGLGAALAIALGLL